MSRQGAEVPAGGGPARAKAAPPCKGSGAPGLRDPWVQSVARRVVQIVHIAAPLASLQPGLTLSLSLVSSVCKQEVHSCLERAAASRGWRSEDVCPLEPSVPDRSQVPPESALKEQGDSLVQVRAVAWRGGAGQGTGALDSHRRHPALRGSTGSLQPPEAEAWLGLRPLAVCLPPYGSKLLALLWAPPPSVGHSREASTGGPGASPTCLCFLPPGRCFPVAQGL